MENQEPVYLNYGKNKISQSDLLNNMASLVNSYVNSLPWSSERKNMFMLAYSDILSKGITGADNSTGVWQIQYGGDPIDLSVKSDKEKEMYGEAAYFIQQLMQSMKPYEEKIKDKPIFDNKEFTSKLHNYISELDFGGTDFNIGGKDDLWNKFDARDSKGIRGTQIRREKFAKYLEGYLNTIKEEDYNFEESPFKSFSEFQTRIGDAINALRSNTDVENKLNRIGIRYSNWFDNGENDTFIDKNGLTWTYKLYNERPVPKPQTTKYKFKLIPTNLKLNGWNRNQIANLGELGILNKINEALSNPTNGDNQSFLRGLGNLIESGKFPILDLDDDEYRIISQVPRFLGLKRGRIKKVTDGVYYDTVTKRWITPDLGNTGNLSLFVLENKKDSTEEREKYLNSSKEGLTSAEWEELASIGFDIASIVDPEMISAAGLALTGSGLRNHALLQQPGGMSTSDKWWQAADYGLSILGSIPVLGDSALAFRAINNLKKAIVPLGIVMAGANVPQAAKAAYNKVVNGLDLTILDWRAIGAVLTAVVGYGRGRLMSKRAEALQRTSGKSTKTINEGSIKTDKGEIKGLDEKTTKELLEGFKKAGNNNEVKTKLLREHPKVQEAAKKQGINLEEASITTESSFRNRGPKFIRKTPEISVSTRYEGIPGNRISTLRAMSQFNQTHGKLSLLGLAEQDWIFRKTGGYTLNSKGNWFKSLWNNLKSSEWDNFENNKPSSEAPVTPPKTSNKVPLEENKTYLKRYDSSSETPTPKPKKPSNRKRNDELHQATLNRFDELEGSLNSGTVSTRRIKTGDLKLGGKNTKVYLKLPVHGLTEKLLKQTISKIILEQKLQAIKSGNYSKKQIKKIGEELRKSRKLGWIKQGGAISLQDTISEFLNKQK